MDLFAPVSSRFYRNNDEVVKGTVNGSSLCLPFHPHGLKAQRLYGLSCNLVVLCSVKMMRHHQHAQCHADDRRKDHRANDEDAAAGGGFTLG